MGGRQEPEWEREGKQELERGGGQKQEQEGDEGSEGKPGVGSGSGKGTRSESGRLIEAGAEAEGRQDQGISSIQEQSGMEGRSRSEKGKQG